MRSHLATFLQLSTPSTHITTRENALGRCPPLDPFIPIYPFNRPPQGPGTAHARKRWGKEKGKGERKGVVGWVGGMSYPLVVM